MDQSNIINSEQGIHTNMFLEIINLKYSRFVRMIEELNSIAQYFVDNDGSVLAFNIVKGTDSTFLWKLTVRIECSKFKVDETDIRSYRMLRLNEFINIYNFIKQQSDAMKVFTPTDETNDHVSNAQLPNESNRLYDSINMSLSQIGSNDDEVCCICMERRPNLILSCTHNYCEACIKEWQVTNSTCPVCRCQSGENDGFVLADKPDYYHLQDEMSKSLFAIAQKPAKKEVTRSNIIISNSSDEED